MTGPRQFVGRSIRGTAVEAAAEANNPLRCNLHATITSKRAQFQSALLKLSESRAAPP
jgi:hypothetical protein